MLIWSILPAKVVNATYRVREAFDFPRCDQIEAGRHDLPSGRLSELVWNHYISNEQCLHDWILFIISTMLIGPCADVLQPTVWQTCGSHWFTQTVGPSLLVLSLTSSSTLPRYISRSGRETAEGDRHPSISERLHSTHLKFCRCHSSIWRPSIDGYWDG